MTITSTNTALQWVTARSPEVGGHGTDTITIPVDMLTFYEPTGPVTVNASLSQTGSCLVYDLTPEQSAAAIDAAKQGTTTDHDLRAAAGQTSRHNAD